MTNNSGDSSPVIPAMATTSLTQMMDKGLQRGTGSSSAGGAPKNRVVGLIVLDIGGGVGELGGELAVDDDGVDKGKSKSHFKQNRKK